MTKSSDDALKSKAERGGAWRKGIRLAINLMRSCEGISFDHLILRDEYREGRPQINLFLAYLRQLQDINHPTAELAFTAALTDFIGSIIGAGSVASEKYYEGFLRRRIESTTNLHGTVEVHHG